VRREELWPAGWGHTQLILCGRHVGALLMSKDQLTLQRPAPLAVQALGRPRQARVRHGAQGKHRHARLLSPHCLTPLTVLGPQQAWRAHCTNCRHSVAHLPMCSRFPACSNPGPAPQKPTAGVVGGAHTHTLAG